jgi:O-acetyl-ADP-ribose deacetylase (regulator of RNase III)
VIEVVRGSLVHQQLDGIVNAANTLMRGGGGVDGKIHQAAGPEMLRALQRLAPRATEVGQVIVTPGFNLLAQHVFHVAGPIWRGGDSGEAELLEASYRNVLLKADEIGCETLGFCSISTGAFRFPLGEAAQIAISTVTETLGHCKTVSRVLFVMFGSAEFEAFNEALHDSRP